MIGGGSIAGTWTSVMTAQPPELQALHLFRETYGAAPEFLARAPGRVELLGNHTDYNGGFVLAVAIDRYTAVAGRSVSGGRGRIRSAAFGHDDFPVDDPERGAPGAWERYVRGVVWSLDVRAGFEASLAGDVPLGAGLSSSASLQAALATFLIASGVCAEPDSDDRRPDAVRMALARALQRSENDFVGVASGLLDQFTVLFGREGESLLLDCRSLAFERLPLGLPTPAIVVCDSKTSRRLADGMYNRRRAECETVVDHFRRLRGPNAVRWLRDVSLEDLTADWDALDPVGRLRARHVLTENARVIDGAAALRRGDLTTFGRLMSVSHASSRDDFANSAPALDALITSAERSPGFLGGKLSGAGWAGCTVNLVAIDSADAFASSVASEFSRLTGHVPDIHVCRSADGAGVVPIS